MMGCEGRGEGGAGGRGRREGGGGDGRAATVAMNSILAQFVLGRTHTPSISVLAG